MTNKTGEAYAFFNCNASKEAIEGEIPDIRRVVETANGLELSLTEVSTLRTRREDPALSRFIETAEIGSIYPSKLAHLRSTDKPKKVRDLRYALHAIYPDKSNEDAAGELVGVINEIYTNHEAGKIFTGAIVGKDAEGEYAVWDNE
ncbi:MAG: hypothetical protein NT076_04100 [Candidatus Pacearchaeota archaeon]|nr:hypothetical protein [Candidatus Pacearchaeota archaeon]